MTILYPEMEQALLNVQLTHPRGDGRIDLENDKKWKKVLNQYLVDKATVKSINGGRLECSGCCLNEEYLW